MSGRSASAPLHVLVTVDFPESFLEEARAVDARVVVHHHPVTLDGAGSPAAVLAQAEVMSTSDVLPGRATAPALRWVQLDTSGIDYARPSALWDTDEVITTLGGVGADDGVRPRPPPQRDRAVALLRGPVEAAHAARPASQHHGHRRLRPDRPEGRVSGAVVRHGNACRAPGAGCRGGQSVRRAVWRRWRVRGGRGPAGLGAGPQRLRRAHRPIDPGDARADRCPRAGHDEVRCRARQR